MKKRCITLCYLLCLAHLLPAQDSLPQFNPKIMVIPFVKKGQDLRQVLESDFNLRVAMTQIRDGFDYAGYPTIDFRARVKQLSNDRAMELENQSSLKQEIIEQSGAEIYVEVESKVVRTTKGNSVTVIVTAFDAFSGESLVNQVANSQKFYTQNYEKLTQKAVEYVLPDLLNNTHYKFVEMLEKGRNLFLNFGLAESATVDFDTDIDGSGVFLSEKIEQWLAEQAFRHQYHIQGVTATKIIIDEFRIPIRDKNTGEEVRPTRIAIEILKFLRGLGLEATRDVQGNKLFFSVQ